MLSFDLKTPIAANLFIVFLFRERYFFDFKKGFLVALTP